MAGDTGEKHETKGRTNGCKQALHGHGSSPPMESESPPSNQLGKIGAYRLRNKCNWTQTDANEGGANVNRRNRMQPDAKHWSKLENRWEQSLGGSSPSPSVLHE